MAEEKPKSIFYTLSQALKGEKKDIPAELNRTNNLVNPSATNQDADFIQQSQQRFLDFQSLKISQDLYTRSVYYDSDRITAYNDYRAMDQSPEISVALDIMADESLSRGDDGEILKIYSEDSRIKRVLKDLFHKTLNVNYNLWFWTRTLLKYGDNFLKLEIDQKLGIYNITQLPTGEIHKEMGWDGNPYSTRFKWDIQNMYFEDFQIAHFSLISDGEKMPYGRSCLDSVRKIWKQLQLAEDAMLVYRMCLQGETRIRTTNGYKYIKDIAVGDEVISYNQSGNLEKSKVIHHINNGKKKLLRIRSIHNELICTETHPILINDNGVIKYVDAAELKIKKHKLINTNTSNLNIKEKEIKLFFTEKYGKLSKKAIDLLRDRKDLNKSSIINSCLKTDKFDNGRIKQFIYSEKKGLPIDIATDVCEKFDIDVKSLIVYNKSFFNEDRLNLPKFVNPEFSRLLGFLFGDGWISKNKFGFAEGVDENVNSQYKKLLEKYFSKVVYEPDKREGKKHGKYTVNSTLAVNILKSLGFNGKANTKRIPSWLFSCSAEIRKEFILGLSDADGCERFTNKGTWFSTIELCNKKLIEDVKELWSSIGLCSGHIKTRKRIGGHVIDKVSGRVVKDTVSHSVTISELELPKYENVISIEGFGEEDVYDISVDNKLHNFIANNVPVHNTRAPERRMFFLDVGNTDAPDVQQYVEKIMSRIKKSQVVDPKTGNINMKFNMMPVWSKTPIPLLDGRTITIEELAKEYESGKENYVYSVQDESHQTVPGKVVWCGKNYTADKLTKVWLDDNTWILTAPEHPFVMRDGSKKMAYELQPGESLMPFYPSDRKMHGKNYYKCVYNPGSNKYEFVHRLIERDVKKSKNKNDIQKREDVGVLEYKNHKVLRVEEINQTEDVYCMTVVGLDGQHDRHNFACLSFNDDLSYSKSGVYVKNTFEEDFVIPVRGDKTGTRVETLPGACLSLDTEIYLLDGRCLSLNDIIKEFESGKKLESYSINPKTGEIVPGKITWAGITRKNTEVIKITLDNGESIVCTPDHKFPTRFNGKKEAKDLSCGESLWSFNKKFNTIRNDKKKKRNDYEMVYDHHKNKWVFTHRLVANFYKLNDVINEFVFDEKNKNKLKETIHHLNFNRFDNSSNNLAFMSNLDHYEYHQHLFLEYSKIGTEVWMEKFNTDPNFKKDVINRLNEIRKNYYDRRTNIKREEHNNAIGDGLKLYFKSLSKEELLLEMKPLFDKQNKARKNLNEKLKNEKFKSDIYKKVSEKSKKTKNLPENKIKYSLNSKKLWENDSFRKSIIEKQSIKYSDFMLSFIIEKYNNGLTSKEIIREVNKPNSEFIIEFNKLNFKNNQIKKMRNGFTHNNLYKMMKHFGYDNWRDFKNKAEYFNHKVVSIEWLNKKQDTGTITIDGDEEFHNFHNFALKCGVFTQNSNLGDIMDIEYLQNKLFTGIKVPKAYLNYAEGLPGSSTLSQADLRFSRTINRFQEAIILELRNIANIHLKLLGFDDDLNNFTLTLTNPSTQQELLKLETMKARNDVFKEMFSSDATSPVSYTWAMEYILGFSKSEIKQMVRQKKIERKMFYEIERAHEEYQDTGIFTELDKKFRKPDFDPNTQIDTENGPGGEDSGGGGGGGSFGGGSSFGMDDLGGGMDMGTETAPETGPEGTEMAGAEDTGTEEEQPPLQENVLLKKNQVFDLKTKNILNGIDSFLKKINQLNENKQ